MVGNHPAPALVVLVPNIMRLLVRPVDVQPLYHLFLVKIDRFIVTIVSRLNAPRVEKSHAVTVAMATTVDTVEEVVIVVTVGIGAITAIAGKLKNY